ncbi:glycosyltransferase family 39 protein [Thioalkalivibrio sp. ALJT]|uniref:glycosyltransferase family 39 protein n=1 Tax=Thioalkalivibrio sp. ALJT TaxID=1158146 RepID=UPI00037C6306|nr:glycosyltransferase family 39 protein [Thioalkalivibrio sp. ALJT]
MKWQGRFLQHPRLTMALAVFGALVGGFVFRALLPAENWFWYDEIYGATFASGTLYEALLGTLRFDLHPPLYYLQLWLWARVDAGDTWLRLNSAAWGLVAAALAWRVARQCLGEREAWIALWLMLVVPAAVATAQDLRMYSMLMALALLSSWGALLWFSPGVAARTGAWMLALAGVAAAYTHATGLLIPMAAAVFSLLLWWKMPAHRVTLRGWLLVQGLVAAAVLPAVLNSMIRSVGHMTVPDGAVVFGTLVRLLLDQAAVQHPALLVLGILLLVGSFLGAWWSSLRWMFVAYVLFPILFLLAVSYFVRPAWHLRALYPLTPFLVIGGAVALARLGDALARIAPLRGAASAPALLMAVLLGVLAAWNAGLVEKTHRYPAAVEFVQRHLAPGDIVWAPDFVTAWAVKRYWIGPQWGSITRIQGEPSSEQWRRIYDRLGDTWLARLGLAPEARSIPAQGTHIVTGHNVDDMLLAHPRIWVVGTPTESLRATLREEGYAERGARDFRGVAVTEFGRSPASN